jgi:hypothetical protein
MFFVHTIHMAKTLYTYLIFAPLDSFPKTCASGPEPYLSYCRVKKARDHGSYFEHKGCERDTTVYLIVG